MPSPNTKAGFGHFKSISGRLGTFKSSELPLDMVRQVQLPPIPATIGGSNNVTFTVTATEARPVPLWIGDDYITLKKSLAYTWNNTSNAILDANGAAATDTDSVLGVWYMYAGLNADPDTASTTTAPTLVLRPSQTAPSGAGRFGGMLHHPGTSAGRTWRYVGFMECTTAATPAFRAAVKTGWWWKISVRSLVIITDAWTAPTAATLSIPRVPGVEIGGMLETGADGQIYIGSHSASTIYDSYLNISEATASNVAQQILFAPVELSVNASATPFYAIAAPAGDFHLTRIKDVV